MIAITTPTGTIGSKVLRNVCQSTDEPVRVLARDRSKLPADLTIEVVEGSLLDPGALSKMMDGARALFWCQPDPNTAPDYLAAYEELSRKGVDAVRNAGVRQVVAISAAGETPDRPAGTLTALHRMEKILSGSGAACRFLRCGSFFDNLLWQWDSILEKGSFTYPLAGDIAGPQVAAADIANVAAGLLARSDWTGHESLQLLGPTPLSYGEMAEILTRELERPVAYEPMEPAAYREVLVSMGSSPSGAQGLLDMFAYFENGYQVAPDAPRAETPATLAAWLNRDQ